jgi:uncharacterized protein YndB with AHSA1/START domain
LKPQFHVQCKIRKPVSDVFDAVVNPEKLSAYFTTAGASAPLVAGTTVMWDFADFPGAFPVHVVEVIPEKKVVLEWQAQKRDYNTQVVMTFEQIQPDITQVKIAESGWEDNEQDIKSAFGNCEGWSQMCACMKAYLEYGIKLREGYY